MKVGDEHEQPSRPRRRALPAIAADDGRRSAQRAEDADERDAEREPRAVEQPRERCRGRARRRRRAAAARASSSERRQPPAREPRGAAARVARSSRYVRADPILEHLPVDERPLPARSGPRRARASAARRRDRRTARGRCAAPAPARRARSRRRRRASAAPTRAAAVVTASRSLTRGSTAARERRRPRGCRRR